MKETEGGALIAFDRDLAAIDQAPIGDPGATGVGVDFINDCN